MQTRRSVLGSDYVDQAVESSTDFDQPFQDLIADCAWSKVWSRTEISKRERSLLDNCAACCTGPLGRTCNARSRNTPTLARRPDDVREALLHVAVYAGSACRQPRYQDCQGGVC